MEKRTRKEISDYVRDHIFDYREMWDDMYEHAVLSGWGNVIRYMKEAEQDACPENCTTESEEEDIVLERGYF